jgi:hypothetical protein
MDVRLREMCKILRIAIFHSKSDQDGFASKILHLYSKRLMCHAKVFWKEQPSQVRLFLHQQNAKMIDEWLNSSGMPL